MIPADTLFEAAKRLHGYLLKFAWDGQALAGPDSGVRFNARVGRFVKSYLRAIPWSDRRIYMQAQGYWILDNWHLFELTGDERYRDIALACSNYVLAAQRPEGYWEYPDPEWRNRIATVEGDFGCLGLVESYRQTGQDAFLAGAKKWYRYLIDEVGFQGSDGMLAINYFSNVRGSMVPNNTTLTLFTLARLADATQDTQYLTTCAAMVAWLNQVQLESGELPYAVTGSQDGRDRVHFLCYQYNAFELLDLVEYYRLTCDEAILPVVEKLAAYLSNGVTETGAASYDCHHRTPEVTYYAAALAAALSQATSLSVGDYRALSERGFRWVLTQQKPDGGFKFHSRANYNFLADRRAYPRNLAMILSHLLLEARAQRTPVTGSAQRDKG